MLLKEYAGKTAPFTFNGELKDLTYLTRVDPLSGRVCKISEERAKRGTGISTNLEIRPIDNCRFCRLFESTPEKRIKHHCGAVSVPNAYPWEKYDWITIYPPFGQHKLLLSDLYFDDLERMIDSSYDLAERCSRDPEVFAFMDFTNWGAFAGASQQHPHSQRRSITFVASTLQEQERQHCLQSWERHGRNLLDMLAEEERLDGRRVIHDDGMYIGASFAPACSDEVIAFPTHDVAHILQTSSQDRKRIMCNLLGVFPALFFYQGVTDLNIAIHMAPYREMEQARKYFRWHVHIYPRKNRLPVDRAGAEIGFDTSVIDVMPERSAESLRRWYRYGPQGELEARLADGSPNHRLIAQLRNLVTNPPRVCVVRPEEMEAEAVGSR